MATGITNFFSDGQEMDYPVFNVTHLRPCSSSVARGNQQKWYDPDKRLFIKGPFDYQGVVYKDYLCEVIASSIGQQLGFDIVPAQVCKIRKGQAEIFGSYTENFLAEGEEHIPFYRLYTHLPGVTDYKSLVLMSTVERVEYVLHVFQKMCNLDASSYLYQMIVLDALVGNEDRHLNNFGVIRSPSTGLFRTAPLFDQGLSLFEHDSMYAEKPLHVCIRKMKSQPFNVDFFKAVEAAEAVTGLSLEPTELVIKDLVFPSPKATGYLCYAAERLGLKVRREGVKYAKRV